MKEGIISGTIIKIYPTKRKDFSCLCIRDIYKKKFHFQLASNKSIKNLKIEIGEDIHKIIKKSVFLDFSPKDIEILRKRKAISDSKLNSEFKNRAPKEILDKEIKKNEEITKKLKSLTN